MGGNTSTNSSSGGGGGGGNNNNNNNNQVNQIANQVKKDIGLVEKKAGPFDYLQSGATTGYYASAYAGTKDADFYGKEASTAAKKRMAEAGLGTYNKDNDSFQNIVGNKIISSTGMMGTSMGSGQNSVMGQIPISKAMFESQRKIQMIATGAMAAVGVPLMGAAFLDYNKSRYSDYVTSFNNSINNTSSTSYAAKSNSNTSDAKIQDTKAQAESGEAAAVEAAILRKQAIARNQAALKGKRTFFSGNTKLIKGAMQ